MRHCIKDNTTKTAEKSINFINKQHFITSYFTQKQADTLTRPTDLGPTLIGIVQLLGADQTDHQEVYLPIIERPMNAPVSSSISQSVSQRQQSPHLPLLALKMTTLRFKHSKHSLPLTFNARPVSLLLHEQTCLNASTCKTGKKNLMKRMTKLWSSS